MAEILVLENFYSDPDFVRQYALNELEWHDKKGNHPGRRSDPDRHPSVKKLLEDTIQKEVTDWDVEWNYSNGAYNLCKAWDKCWIHSDWGTTYACVVYLTPDAPIESGTLFVVGDDEIKEFISKDPINIIEKESPLESVIGNVYNRMLLFRGDIPHKSNLAGFGDCLENGRLTQVFFFDEVR